MIIQKTDLVTFQVYFKKDNELVRKLFNSYTDALQYVASITETAWLDMRVINQAGDSGFSAPLIKSKNGHIETVHGFYIKQLRDLGLAA